jgi:hypothetical protein
MKACADNSTKIIEAMHDLAVQLQKQRFSTVQEKRTQIDVEQYLTVNETKFEREKRLSDHDIPDFLIHNELGGIVLEVKTRCARKAIYRQLERYAEHREVDGLILLTGTSMGLPPTINGKPAIVVSLGAGWL